MEKRASLRFVLLCDSLDLPAWQANCVLEAMGHGVAELVGVVVRAPEEARSGKSRWQKRWADRDLTLWRLFNRLYVEPSSKATASKSIRRDVKDAPIFVDKPVPVGRFAESLSASGIDFIENARPDFILRFGFGILSGDILSCAKYGVWSYHHGDPVAYRGQPPGFWEIMNGASSAGAILQVLGNELDAGGILHAGHFQVTPHSYAKTRDTLYFGSASWVRRMCADILANGWRSPVPLAGSHGPVFRQPKNKDMIEFLGKTLAHVINTQLSYKLYRQNWNCAVVPAPVQEVAGLEGPEKQRTALLNAHWMPMSRGTFQADPFGYQIGEKEGIRILFELFKWADDRGEIAAVDYEGGQFGPCSTVLDAKTHLSYPFVIALEDGLHFVPEHSEAKNVSAFGLNSSGEADRKRTIFPNFDQLDCTFVEWDGMFYMFSLDESVSKNTDLNIFFAKDIRGPWKRHPLNPVKSDIRSARPGGTPFVNNGKLYRPSQDCSSHYGSAVTINEIGVLSELDFKETPVCRVEPVAGGNYEYGLHTLSAVGDITLIDGAKKRPVFSV